MCDFDGGDFGGAYFPMNTPNNTNGIGDPVPPTDNSYGSGDMFYGPFMGYPQNTGKKKEKPAMKKGSGNPFDTGSGNIDMSPRPLYVPKK
jgi:hypothetical protein